MLLGLLLAIQYKPIPLPPGPVADASYLPQLIAKARAQRMAQDPTWLALLHWRGRSSEIDSQNFFRSAQGFRNPQAELEATLKAFFEPPLSEETMPVFERASDVDLTAADDGKMHPQCRYPARLITLRKLLKIDPNRLPSQPCVRLGDWFRLLDPGPIYFVYADAYLNNPSAAYGHNFLRIAKRSSPEHPLLSYVINFAAEPDTRNAFLYAFKGIFGLFPGHYSTMPYYLKVREYIDAESRDLWEYELNLTAEERLRMLLHLWELRGAWARYYFFDENCTYHLMGLIEVARPATQLRSRFRSWVMPVDLMRIMTDLKLLTSKPLYRPSRANRLLAMRRALTGADAAKVPAIGRGDFSVLAGHKPARQAELLDASIEWFEYHNDPQELDDKQRATRQQLITRRAQSPATTKRVVQPPIAEPRQGHRPPRLWLAGGLHQGLPTGFLQWTASYHDHLDQPAGRSRDTRLELGAVDLRFKSTTRRVVVDRWSALDLFSATPWTRWIPIKSWFLEAGYRRLLEEDESLAAGELATGWGLSLALGDSRLWSMAEVVGQVSPDLPSVGRVGGGLRAGMILRPFSRFRMTLDGRSLWYVGADTPHHQFKAAAAIDLSLDWQLRAVAKGYPQLDTAHLGIAWHY